MAAVAAEGAGGGVGGPPLAGAGRGDEAAVLADSAEAMVRTRFANFLREFEVHIPHRTSGMSEEGESQRVREYEVQINTMAEMDQSTLFVDFSHLFAFDRYLATTLQEEYYRFEPHVRAGLAEVVQELQPEFAQFEGDSRDFFVAFYNLMDKLRVRELRCAQVGQLVSFSGTVTRTSEVRPELIAGAFRCEDCATLVRNVEQQFKYTTPQVCPNAECGNRTKWQLVVERSRFADWQRVRVQENAEEIPAGSMPRSVDVVLRHAAVERAKAGDKVAFTGMLVVVPDVGQLMKAGMAPRSVQRPAGGRGQAVEGVRGLKDLGVRDLTYRLAFIASAVNHDGPGGMGLSPDDADAGQQKPEEEFSEADKAEFHAAVERNRHEFYDRMARSVAPSVFGHMEVKRGILLMLLGGVHKTTGEGIRLRGDINVCVVGDPATAKSHFLKYTCKFLPRTVYASGKASSSAGLTASVARDRDTGEFTIEAGALMLADNGVCCIDEFDKMDPGDQVAIHEAMEQQTISITKAGIQATLNARTSILAAANPVMGRYDRSRTLRQNVALSPPIMSRFDLFFVVLDDCDPVQDAEIARHIVRVHQHREAALHPEFDTEFMRRFVRYARTLNPVFDPAAASSIERCFRRLRQSDAAGGSSSSYRITVRQLESMIRLSEAIARLHLDAVVRENYVMEAFRLLRRSVLHVDSGTVHLGAGGGEEGAQGPSSPARSVSTRGAGTPARSTPGRGGSTDDEQVVEFTVQKDEIDAFRVMILTRINELTTPENAGAIKQGELVSWYIQQLRDAADLTAEEIAAENTRAHLMIDYIISSQHELMIVEETREKTVSLPDGTQVTERVPVQKLEGDDPETLRNIPETEKIHRLIAMHPDATIPDLE